MKYFELILLHNDTQNKSSKMREVAAKECYLMS